LQNDTHLQHKPLKLKQGINMNKASLIEVTGIVLVAAFATFIVDAKQPIEVADISKTQEAGQQMDFSHIIAKFDSDKDGLLNKSEIEASQNDVLMRNFKTIDANQDDNISTEEISLYTSTIKIK
jgi:Ca2+-binding EF-hand superfamily protein